MALVNKVLIVGGGIGGMCAAIQLSKQGIAVDLVEINPKWTVYGAGITISGPTLRALRAVGVVDEVIARGGHWSEIDICAADGHVTHTVPMAASGFFRSPKVSTTSGAMIHMLRGYASVLTSQT